MAELPRIGLRGGLEAFDASKMMSVGIYVNQQWSALFRIRDVYLAYSGRWAKSWVPQGVGTEARMYDGGRAVPARQGGRYSCARRGLSCGRGIRGAAEPAVARGRRARFPGADPESPACRRHRRVQAGRCQQMLPLRGVRPLRRQARLLVDRGAARCVPCELVVRGGLRDACLGERLEVHLDRGERYRLPG